MCAHLNVVLNGKRVIDVNMPGSRASYLARWAGLLFCLCVAAASRGIGIPLRPGVIVVVSRCRCISVAFCVPDR